MWPSEFVISARAIPTLFVIARWRASLWGAIAYETISVASSHAQPIPPAPPRRALRIQRALGGTIVGAVGGTHIVTPAPCRCPPPSHRTHHARRSASPSISDHFSSGEPSALHYAVRTSDAVQGVHPPAPPPSSPSPSRAVPLPARDAIYASWVIQATRPRR